MFTRLQVSVIDAAALDRVEEIVRGHFALDEQQIVLVSEENTRVSGAPERMTAILF